MGYYFGQFVTGQNRVSFPHLVDLFQGQMSKQSHSHVMEYGESIHRCEWVESMRHPDHDPACISNVWEWDPAPMEQIGPE